MYDPKKIIDISNALIKGYTSKYDRYLDDRRTEWANLVDKNFRLEPPGDDKLNKAAKERLSLLREIVSENEKYCRRDIEIPIIEFEEQMEKINKFKKLRKEEEILEEFPGILAEEANLYMLKSDFSTAFDKLDQAIGINNKYDELIVKRDNVRYMTDQVRCLYMTKNYDGAIEKATEAQRTANKIDQKVEKVEWEKYAAAPGLQFIPITVHGYFAACDARVQHENWENNEKLQKEFSGLWSDSVTKHNVPKSWRTPMKIAAVSDRVWVERTESYVHEIAEQLYIELAPGAAHKIVRIFRAKWGGFNLHYPKSIAASIALIAFIASADVNKEYSYPEIKNVSITYAVNQSDTTVSADDLSDAFDHYFQNAERLTPSKVLENEINRGEFDFAEEQQQRILLVSSGSEGSVLRV